MKRLLPIVSILAACAADEAPAELDLNWGQAQHMALVPQLFGNEYDPLYAGCTLHTSSDRWGEEARGYDDHGRVRWHETPDMRRFWEWDGPCIERVVMGYGPDNDLSISDYTCSDGWQVDGIATSGGEFVTSWELPRTTLDGLLTRSELRSPTRLDESTTYTWDGDQLVSAETVSLTRGDPIREERLIWASGLLERRLVDDGWSEHVTDYVRDDLGRVVEEMHDGVPLFQWTYEGDERAPSSALHVADRVEVTYDVVCD